MLGPAGRGQADAGAADAREAVAAWRRRRIGATCTTSTRRIKPRALRLPAGRGAKLRDDMRHLVEELLAAVPTAFDSDEYRAHREQIDAEFNERQEKAFGELAEDAAGAQDVALLRTPTGFTLAPVKKGEVIGTEEFAALSEEERKRITAAIESLQGRARAADARRAALAQGAARAHPAAEPRGRAILGRVAASTS